MIFALGLGRYAIVDRNGKPVHGELDSSSSEVEAWLRTDPKKRSARPIRNEALEAEDRPRA
jgi:hypothetical protein